MADKEWLLSHTSHESDPDALREKYDQACVAWIVEDALEGHFAERYPYGASEEQLRRRANVLFDLKRAYGFAAVALLALLLVETPSWCYHRNTEQAWRVDCFARNTTAPGEYFRPETFGLPFLRPWVGWLLESACMALCTWALYYESCLTQDLHNTEYHENECATPTNDGGRKHANPDRAFLQILAVMWADLFAQVAGGFSFRVAYFGRLALLFYWPRARDVFTSARSALGNFTNIVLVWATTVIFFAWLVNVILHDMAAQGQAAASLGGAAFDGFVPSVWSLFSIATSSSFPDAMDPMVGEMRWTITIFYPFVCLTVLLFTPLMLAVVYNAYQSSAKRNLKDFYIKRNRGLATVFRILAAPNAEGELVISFENFERLVENLARLPVFSGKLKKENADILFGALDDNGNSELCAREFLDAINSLLLITWVTHEKSRLIRVHGFKLRRLTWLVTSGRLDRIMSVVLCLNLVFVVAESYWLFNDLPNPAIVNVLENAFTAAYMLDVLARLSVWSWGTYWANFSNRFDFVVSVVLFVAGIAITLPSLRHYRPVLVYLSVLRVLRVVRLIGGLPRFRVLLTTLANLWVVSGDMLLMLGVTTLGFAMLGHALFGGKLSSGSPALQGSDYLSAGYILWNFNDMLGSLLTVFNMLINSYMPQYADALDRVSALPYAGTCFCVLLFFVGANVGFNIVTAFLLDVFVSLSEAEEAGGLKSEEDYNLVKMKSILKREDKLLHWRIPQCLQRLRAMAGIIAGLDDAIKEAREEVLGNLKPPPAVGEEEGPIQQILSLVAWDSWTLEVPDWFGGEEEAATDEQQQQPQSSQPPHPPPSTPRSLPPTVLTPASRMWCGR